MGDPTGENFPWVPPTFADSIGDTFVRNDGSEVKYAELAGKTIAIYFSAHWCPPCRGFTPELAKVFGVNGIPSFHIIEHDGTVINNDGRGAVGGDPDGADFPWHQKPVNDLAAGP